MNRLSIIDKIRVCFNLLFFNKETIIIYPYKFCSDLRDDLGRLDCDNIRRISNCKNEGTVALEQLVIKFEMTFILDHYHVCDSCFEKYDGKIESEKHNEND